MLDGRTKHRAQSCRGVDGGLDRLWHAEFINETLKYGNTEMREAFTIANWERKGI
jgi:hypothetical protein